MEFAGCPECTDLGISLFLVMRLVRRSRRNFRMRHSLYPSIVASTIASVVAMVVLISESGTVSISDSPNSRGSSRRKEEDPGVSATANEVFVIQSSPTIWAASVRLPVSTYWTMLDRPEVNFHVDFETGFRNKITSRSAHRVSRSVLSQAVSTSRALDVIAWNGDPAVLRGITTTSTQMNLPPAVPFRVSSTLNCISSAPTYAVPKSSNALVVSLTSSSSARTIKLDFRMRSSIGSALYRIVCASTILDLGV